MLIMLLPLFLSLSFLDESKALQSERGKKELGFLQNFLRDM